MTGGAAPSSSGWQLRGSQDRLPLHQPAEGGTTQILPQRGTLMLPDVQTNPPSQRKSAPLTGWSWTHSHSQHQLHRATEHFNGHSWGSWHLVRRISTVRQHKAAAVAGGSAAGRMAVIQKEEAGTQPG